MPSMWCDQMRSHILRTDHITVLRRLHESSFMTCALIYNHLHIMAHVITMTDQASRFPSQLPRQCADHHGFFHPCEATQTYQEGVLPSRSGHVMSWFRAQDVKNTGLGITWYGHFAGPAAG